ncbi:MAG: hypothetical protein ACRDO0_16260, partial [Nocardioidaceae bacterium]
MTTSAERSALAQGGDADTEVSAREDWEQRIATRSDERQTAPVPDLAPPGGLHATGGSGHVTLRWQPVEGAVGYLVHRAPAGSPRERLEP